MTAHTKIKQQLLLHLPLKMHIDLVLLESPMEELAIVRQESSQGKVSSQVENILVAETEVPALIVNIA